MGTYIAIDLKSFYASVECVDRKLDPLGVNLVVADESRSDKTICLAVSPSLKAEGVPSRPRLFEVKQKVAEINERRRMKSPGRRFRGKTYFAAKLEEHPYLELDYITAAPRMARYIAVSSQIYRIYLKYIAPEDIHVYSIDEVFIDAGPYLNTYRLTAHELAKKIIQDIVMTTGITATAGIGTNLYLAKVAMDIIAKHTVADEYGVRIAELDEMTYRQKLWSHRPLTDFWRVGNGYTSRLKRHRIYTMGDIARCSLDNEALLYRLFGVNAELLIDHAWGYEPCTMAAIKAYRPINSSLSNGQVLQCPYTYEQAATVIMEMADSLALDLVAKQLQTSQLTVTIGYDIENLTTAERAASYKGIVCYDHYGRPVPKHAHGTCNIAMYTSSSELIMESSLNLYRRITDPTLLIRRINITACNTVTEAEAIRRGFQLDLFSPPDFKQLQREKNLQLASLEIRSRYGKNSILRGTSFMDGATARERNLQIGGHKA